MNNLPIGDLAPFPMSTQRHLREIVLMQKFASATLHAQISQPVAAYDRAKTGIMFGTGQVGSLLIGIRGSFYYIGINIFRIVILDRVGKYASCFPVWERIEGFRDSVFECVVFKVVFDGVDCQQILR